MSTLKIIGIVGGMGPAAGADLFDKIVRATNARSDQEHVPVIMMSYPGEIGDRTSFLIDGVGSNPAGAIYDIIRDLENAGASVVGIPCNTAHAPPILDLVRQQLDDSEATIRLVSMIDVTVEHLTASGEAPATPVGVLSTAAVRTLRIYAKPLAAGGIDVLHPSDADQDSLVTPAIFSREFGLKAVSPATQKARRCVVEALDHLVDRGARAIILGCTELPLAVPESEYRGVPLIDPADLLARSLIRCTYPERLGN